MGLFDSVFGGSESADPVPLEPRWQREMRMRCRCLTGRASRTLGSYPRT
jgi:hypothetical protein